MKFPIRPANTAFLLSAMGRFFLLCVLLVGLAVFAISRLKLDPGLLALFPSAGPAVEAMRGFDASFAAHDDVILSLEGETAETAEQSAQSLAAHLTRRSGLFRRVAWGPPWEDSESALAPLVAYLWFNGDARRVQDLAAEFEADAGLGRLENSLETLATTTNLTELRRLSVDPLRLSAFDGASGLRPSDLLRFPFASRDGRFRVLRIEPAATLGSTREVAQWESEAAAAVESWKQQHPEDRSRIQTRLTGRKIYIAAMARDLKQDLFLSVVLTAACISLLVFGLHRNVLPFLGILFVLVLTLVCTLAAAGLLFPHLNAISMGFAAIVLGLVVDYGFLIWHEARNDPAPPSVLRRRLTPTIFWASLTTAIVFLGLNLSDLPGIAQLGALVACGTVTGALLMLLLYTRMLPFLLPASAITPASAPSTPYLVAKPSRALVSTAILAGLTAAVLLFRGPPTLDSSAETIQPRSCPSLDEFQNAIVRLGTGALAYPLLLTAGSDAAMLEALETSESILAEHPEVEGFTLPSILWPNPDQQEANRSALAQLAAARPALLRQAEDAGFTGEALTFLDTVFARWTAWNEASGAVLPDDPTSTWLLSRALDRSSLPYRALGLVTVRESHPSPAFVRDLNAAGAGFVGWAFLNDGILQSIRHDLRHVVLPLAAALGIMLCAAFRSAREVVLAIAAVGLSLGAFLSLMSLFGWQWNLINLMALPLLLGAGIDYAIHIQFALRRNGGDLRRTRAAVGRALLLCGASTAIGFASLAPARYGGLSSLGLVCATGILTVMLVSVFLLPHWWVLFNRSLTAPNPLIQNPRFP
ncbi:MAG TPA: MMPL family transporter [Verrucomicrobiales bacterium]|nr:MMPL family transporter [Verrucomicrobiales bacterium]